MRIMLWSEHFSPYIGGVERSAALLLPELRRRGYEIAIATSHHYMTLTNEEVWEGIPLYRFHFNTSLNKGDAATWLREQKRLAKVVDAFEPELHHVFSIGSSMVACLALLKQRPAPLVASLVNMEMHPDRAYAPEGVIAKTLLAATRVTTVSRAILEQTVHYLPALAERITVLHYGYPIPNLEPAPLAMPPRLLLLGRMVEQKGGEMAIAAFARLVDRYPDVRLICAGDGPERARWQELAAPLGDRVEFTGWTDPHLVYALYNSVTIVLMPSRWEGLPLVSLEAGYMARPLVATRIPGMSEIVIDGETGLLVEQGDDADMAEAIAYLLDHSDQATAMGQAARQRVLQHFTFDRYVAAHETLYQEIMEPA